MSRFKRICRKTLCNELTKDDSGFCLDHKKENWRRETKDRGPKMAFYETSRWRKMSKRIRRMNPLCAMCDRASEEVDHIIPAHLHHDPFDESNLQQLCKSCHARKRGKEAHVADELRIKKDRRGEG